MNRHHPIEVNSEGRILAWEPHPLSAWFAEQGVPELVAEPRVVDPQVQERTILQWTVDGNGVTWTADGWDGVEIQPSGGFSSAVPAVGVSLMQRPPSGELRWTDHPGLDGIEITPVSGNGARGVTVRMTAPAGVPRRRIAMVGVPVLGGVSLRLEQSDLNPAVSGHIRVCAFENRGTQDERRYRRATHPVELEQTCLLPLPQGFEGIVAAYDGPSQRPRLLECRPVFGDTHVGARPGPEDWMAIEAALGRKTGLFASWPRFTRSRLSGLCRTLSRRAGVDALHLGRMARLHPTGIFRLAVAAECGLQVSAWDPRIPELLDEGDLCDALASLWPDLPAAVTAVAGGGTPDGAVPGELAWVIGHADLPHVTDAAGWAAGAGPDGLETALALVPHRDRAQALTAEIHPSSSEFAELVDLLEDIEAAPTAVEFPHAAVAGLDELAGRVAAYEDVEVLPTEEPPFTAAAYARWDEARQRLVVWRRLAAEIVQICSFAGPGNGGMGSVAAQAEPALADLATWSADLAQPPPVCIGADPQDVEHLEDLTRRAIEGAHAEPESWGRDQVVAWIARVVVPHAEAWCGRRKLIERAHRLGPAHEPLAEALGLPGDWWTATARHEAPLRAFLALMDEIEGCLSRWQGYGKGRLAADAEELAHILATPGHAAIEAAHRQAVELFRKLGAQTALEPPAQPPARPTRTTIDGFRAWWTELLELDRIQGDLLQRHDRHMGLIETARRYGLNIQLDADGWISPGDLDRQMATGPGKE